MKCLFATKFYSLIWHINEEAFGVRHRPGGSYRWQRCCSTPGDERGSAPRAASLRRRLRAGPGPALVFKRDTHLCHTKERKTAPTGSQLREAQPGSIPRPARSVSEAWMPPESPPASLGMKTQTHPQLLPNVCARCYFRHETDPPALPRRR